MSNVSKGSKAAVFVDDKAIALATNHTVTVNANITEQRTKDDGEFTKSEADGYTWGMSSDNVIGKNENVTNEQTIVDLIDTWLAMRKVTVATDAVLPTTGRVPDSGWEPSGDGSKFPVSTGEAYIESISISAGPNGYATSSVSFKGQGELN